MRDIGGMTSVELRRLMSEAGKELSRREAEEKARGDGSVPSLRSVSEGPIKEVGQPTWKALDRATMEALVGRKLD